MNGICFFGDSLARGVIFDTVRNRYTILKESFVNLFSESTETEVKNHSRFGSTVTQGLTQFEKHQSDAEAAEAIVFEFGGNDSDFDWNAVSEAPDAVHLPKTEYAVFIDTYKALIEKAKSMGKKVFMLNLPPVDYNKYFSLISNGRNGENILRWLGGTSDFIYRWHERYNDAISSIAAAMKVPMIDIRSAFLEKRDYSDYLCVDGIHPNEKGHRLIADILIDYRDGNTLTYQT